MTLTRNEVFRQWVYEQWVSSRWLTSFSFMKKKPPVTKRLSAMARAASKKRKTPPSALLKMVGERIREVRIERGLSQEGLAYSIPMDRAHVGLIENGKRSATVTTLVKLAVALECEVGDLFPYIDDLEAVLGEVVE